MVDSQFLGDHWVYFGDGNQAQIVDTREFIRKKTGVDYIKFLLLPSKRIEAMYDISEEQDQSGFIIREYPKTEVLFNERGVARTRCWVFTDFMSGPTPASRRFEDLGNTINDTARLLKSANAAKNRALQELEKERQQKVEAIKLQTKIITEVARARGKGADEDNDGDED